MFMYSSASLSRLWCWVTYFKADWPSARHLWELSARFSTASVNCTAFSGSIHIPASAFFINSAAKPSTPRIIGLAIAAASKIFEGNTVLKSSVLLRWTRQASVIERNSGMSFLSNACFKHDKNAYKQQNI